MEPAMLTTTDNPYDPFTQYDLWLAWDEDAGYYTNSYLARIANSSPHLSDEDQDLEQDRAIDEIIEYNLTGKYRKVFPAGSKNPQKSDKKV